MNGTRRAIGGALWTGSRLRSRTTPIRPASARPARAPYSKTAFPPKTPKWRAVCRNAQARREVDLLRRGIVKMFDDVDLLVLPTMKAPAEPIDGPGGPPRGNNNVALDVFGLPAISVPCGFSSAGLPIGLQIVGAPFAGETVLQLATGWHRWNPDL